MGKWNVAEKNLKQKKQDWDIYTFLSIFRKARPSFINISEGTAFLLQGLTYNVRQYVSNTLKKEGRAFQNIDKNIYMHSRL